MYTKVRFLISSVNLLPRRVVRMAVLEPDFRDIVDNFVNISFDRINFFFKLKFPRVDLAKKDRISLVWLQSGCNKADLASLTCSVSSHWYRDARSGLKVGQIGTK